MNPTSLTNPPETPSLQKFAIRTPSQLQRRCDELRSEDFIIKGLMPRQSLTISVGDSGIGKTPLQYQKAICVAAGVPFLGAAVQRGPVLYMDCENGIAEVANMVARISKHLGLSAPPENLYLWNMNDCAEDFAENKIREMIREIQPILVMVDPYNAVFRSLEKDNTSASDEFRTIRSMMKEFRCAFDGLHHVRKRDLKNEVHEPFETANLRDWFLQTRGPRVLINGSDIRIAMDEGRENCLLVRGFRRVDGEFPPIHIKRVLDEDGEPVGYDRMAGAEMLRNPGHRDLHDCLPEEFSFKTAKLAYGKADEATNSALKALIAAGVLTKVQAGLYRKIGLAPGVTGVAVESPANMLIM